MAMMIDSSPAVAMGNQNRWKRRAPTSDDEDESSQDVKKSKHSWYLRLESESPTPTDEDEESVCSTQDYETDFARDTADTSTDSTLSSNESNYGNNIEFDITYEVDLNPNQTLPAEATSSSEPENIEIVKFTISKDDGTFCDTEDLADDSDDSQSSVDSEIRRADFWTCVQCKNPNINTMFRYCKQCYQVRRTHFPRSRPKLKPRTQKYKKFQSKIMASESVISVSSSQEFSEIDSGIGSSQDLDKPSGSMTRECSSDSLSTDSQSSNRQTKVTENKFGYSEMSSSMIVSEKLQLNKEASQPDTEGESSRCIMCTVAPKNSAFVHGKTLHICCCYHCSVKVCKNNGYRCPICNRKVREICKVFYV